MKFADHLSAHITPEWHSQYIHYDHMKKLLEHALMKSPDPEDVEARAAYMNIFEEEFFQFCFHESEKVNSFFGARLAESTRRTLELNTQLTRLMSPSTSYNDGPDIPLSKKKIEKVKHGLIQAFSEAYLALILLQNFQTLNYQGFRKILKKHDKLLRTESGMKWFRGQIEGSTFYKDSTVDDIIHQVEDVVTTYLLEGNRSKAMNRLRVPPLARNTSPTFLLGFFAGIILLILLTISSSILENLEDFDWGELTRLYRGPILLNIFIFLIGVNTYGWRAHGVNHILIFEIDPRNHLTAQNILEIALFLNCVCGGSIILFLRSKDLNLSTHTSPLALLLFYFVFLLNPTNNFWRSGRWWVIRKLFRVLTAPFHTVDFADFWLADQLSSLTQCILDLQYLICIYVSFNDCVDEDGISCHCSNPLYYIRPLIRCLPPWLRFMQCLRRYYDSRQAFPHLYNAGKYACALFVVSFSKVYRNLSVGDEQDESLANTFLGLWIFAGIISSCYSYYWDIRMDWGLFDANAGENTFLREEIVYNKKIYYYLAIVQDLILRFAWAVQLSLTEMGVITSEVVISCLAPAELLRRFVWNFFRLENEHLNNCGNFRAVRDISIVPMLKVPQLDGNSELSLPSSPSSSTSDFDSNANYIARSFEDKHYLMQSN